jgi:hypothetical protein
MMFCGMMLGWIVAKVFGTWVPCDIDVFVADLVRDPKVAHFHGAGPLAFHGVIGNANGGFVVAVDGCGGLGVPHFFQDESEDLDFLRIEEEGSKLRFSSGRRN